MVAPRIRIDDEAIADFCKRHRISRLAPFGSVLREDFTDSSDVDVLVEFDPNVRIGWDFITIQDELGDLLGYSVDLLTPGSLRPAYRDEILSTSRDIYVAQG